MAMKHFPAEITDGNGVVWKPAAHPVRNSEPVYYSTGSEDWALTPSEIKAQYGIRGILPE
ncbi:hypothetical protein ACFY97_18775 [Streptomyces klenkii]|uniref:hypothetical protein n=1 Tax=Streptomyces klenkii TaxID=1420899 RepID=UPI0036E3056C